MLLVHYIDSGRVGRSAAYDGLDPSEKGAISYFLGMTLTKAAVHRLCAVPWLMHLDVYRAVLNLGLGAGRTRPDLIGQDKLGRWVVVESKGRTNGFDDRALVRAKEQARTVDIGGEAPYLAIGTLVHFDGDVLQLHLRDPQSYSIDKTSLPLTPATFFEGYYRPFRSWLQRNPNTRRTAIQGRSFVESLIEPLNLSVGLESDLLEDLLTPERVRSAREFGSGSARELPENTFVGADGVLVRTGSLWNSSNMRRQPQERTRAN
jgi:hypothetical protein